MHLVTFGTGSAVSGLGCYKATLLENLENSDTMIQCKYFFYRITNISLMCDLTISCFKIYAITKVMILMKEQCSDKA